jgi:hypothetical protein
MKAQHTPGPWIVAEGGASLLKVCATTPRGLVKSIAQVGGYGGDSRPANACLISTAPELLALLQEAQERPLITEGSDWWSRVGAVVAKATGEKL